MGKLSAQDGASCSSDGSNSNATNSNSTNNTATTTQTTTTGEDVIKSGWLTNRSQLKSRFSFTSQNKDRWFVLTRSSLIFYNNGDAAKRKEKGRIALKDVVIVERVALKDETKKSQLTFQIGYRPAPESSTSSRRHRGQHHHPRQRPHHQQQAFLYIQAKSEADREEWMQLVRNLCRQNVNLADKYHPGQWLTGSNRCWSCCGDTSAARPGCQEITWTPRLTKIDQASPQADNDEVEMITDMMNKNHLHIDSGEDNALQKAKVVIAVYPFTAIEPGDLTLEKGDEYVVLDDSQDHWWQVQNKHGQVGFIPSNYVKEKDALGLQNFDWCVNLLLFKSLSSHVCNINRYVADMSRQRSEMLLKNEDKEGCFVVRNSSTKGLYTLSLYTKIPHPQVRMANGSLSYQDFLT